MSNDYVCPICGKNLFKAVCYLGKGAFNYHLTLHTPKKQKIMIKDLKKEIELLKEEMLILKQKKGDYYG